MTRYLFISALVAGVPALVLTAMILLTPAGKEKPGADGKTSPPLPATEEGAKTEKETETNKRVEGTFHPAKDVKVPVGRIEKMRSLLDKVCEEEERMAARVKRVMEEPGITVPGRRTLLSELAHRSAKESLEAASEMLDAAHTVPAGELRVSLCSGVLQTRVEINPEEALKLCGVMHEREDQVMARNFVVRHWALRDFETATRAVERLEFPEDRRAAAGVGLVEALLNRKIEPLEKMLARKDLNSEVAEALAAIYALNWKGSLEDLKEKVATSGRPQVMTALMVGYAAQRPAEALPFLREHPDVELSPEVMNRMGYHLAERNAAASLTDLLDGVDFKSRAGVLKATFSQWMLADLKGAGEWLRTKDSKLGNAAEADELRLMMVNAMKGGGAKESARAWAERISDPEKREKAVRDLE